MSANFRLVNSYSLATNTLMGMIMSIDCLYIYMTVNNSIIIIYLIMNNSVYNYTYFSIYNHRQFYILCML